MRRPWYSNTRKTIGTGKPAPRTGPSLIGICGKGPAPRRPYTDNVQPYNWHWFRIYGTGEALNNGTHEVDVLPLGARCGLSAAGLLPPVAGTSFQDDWQFYDTLVTSFDYKDKNDFLGGQELPGA